MADRLTELQSAWSHAIRTLGGVSDSANFWSFNTSSLERLPHQGWKIHIPASPVNAAQILKHCWGIASKYNISFKFPNRIADIIKINSGFGSSYSQIGKIFTFYFPDEQYILAVAKALSKATDRYKCPTIPFDCRFRDARNVYFRYGVLNPNELGHFIQDTNGNLTEDLRDKNKAVPQWLRDSAVFKSLTETHQLDLRITPFPKNVLGFEVLSQRGKGGVYKVLDLSEDPGVIRVLKEGRSGGEISLLGIDGYILARKEAANLRRISHFSTFVPQLRRTVDSKRSYYILMNLAEGDSLPSSTNHLSNASKYNLGKIIISQIRALNKNQWMWRDCKPTNMVVSEHSVTFLDFEGACRFSALTRSRWGTDGYIPDPAIFPLASQDLYAAALSIIQMFIGDFSPPSSRNMLERIEGLDVPKELIKPAAQFLRAPSPCSLNFFLSHIETHMAS